MARRRDYGKTSRAFSQGDPGDMVGNVVASAVVDGGGWLLGRLRDKLANRQPASDAHSLPLASNHEDSPSGNVRVTSKPKGGE